MKSINYLGSHILHDRTVWRKVKEAIATLATVCCVVHIGHKVNLRRKTTLKCRETQKSGPLTSGYKTSTAIALVQIMYSTSES